MRLRIPEAFNGRSPYQVARDSKGRLNEVTLYRFVKKRGKITGVKLSTLQSLCDVLGVPLDEIIEYKRQP